MGTDLHRQMSRREVLRFGTVSLGGLGLHLPAAVEAQGARSGFGRARSCILLFMDGGPSHIDLFDLKPEAPAEIRGPFASIPTTVPGTRVCEHLPRIARQMHRIAQVRSVRHEEMIHDPAVYQALTGYSHINSRGDLEVQATDHPQVGAAFGAVDPTPATIPKVIELPETMRMGARILPGQNAGYLGSGWDPYRISVSPGGEVAQPDVAPQPQLRSERLGRRRRLLEQVNERVAGLDAVGSRGRLDLLQRQALGLLAEPKLRQAFDLERERPQLRDLYGRHRHGQSVLLARRLVEAGARFVTVYWGKEKQDWADGQGVRLANNPWDTHRNHFPLTRDELTPRADQALAALLNDLPERGLLNETLVVWMGEFGRSPVVSQFASREHWPYAYTALFAGAGVPGGAVYGRTDATAAEVVENPVSPADLTATILHALGVAPFSLLRGPQGQPMRLSSGTPIRALLG